MVLAALAVAWAHGLRGVEGVRLANLAAGIEVTLTGAQPVRLEGLVGEVPKKRSRLRQFTKRAARFEFSR